MIHNYVMRKWFIRVFIVTWVTTLSFASIAQDDKEAIKEVIAKETIAFLNVDYKKWSECWLKVPYAYWSYSDSTTISRTEGWDLMDKTFADYFKNARPSSGKVSNEWIELRIYENGAYVRFAQKVIDEYETSETSQIRILEKKEVSGKLFAYGP